ncbi:S9 family peptidase [Alkaliphilus serpentinus]|uniref:S9 family peptidase n=1 Tax=Alkaliphilus serpentinus TaxID=1482731 RepID=A0A833MA94_9FIRM|nr:S9 family peptidase [Alkaliphilus serpentinus]KAB3530440.1 S9 family peptidase [Alkaliphilus serpentinus]
MEKILMEDFTKFKFLSSLEYAPKGKNACFTVYEADMEENGYKSNLWLYNDDDNTYFQLTSGDKERSFIWLNDEEILFSGERNPKDQEKNNSGEINTKFYKINIKGGEAQELFKIPHHVTSIKALKDGNYIFSAVYNPYKKSLEGLSKEEREEELKNRKEDKDYEVMEEIPFWSNGAGYTNRVRSRLYKYDVKEGTAVPITTETMSVEAFQLNKNKSKVVFNATDYTNKMDFYNHVYIGDLETNSLNKITDEEARHTAPHFISDEEIILLINDMKDYGLNQNSKFYIMNTKSKESRCITPDFDNSVGSSVGSDCRYGPPKAIRFFNDKLYFLTTNGGSSFINTLDLDGNIEKLTKDNGSIDSFAVNDHKILIIGLRGQDLQEVYRLSGNEEIKITAFNKDSLKDKYIATPQHVGVDTEKGVGIDGWVLLPKDYDEKKSYPAILDIHGGPKTVYGEVYYHEMQYWANEGYFVFFCNPRGSDGKGNAFADIRGKYGTIDYEDIMKFTDVVLEKYPSIDKGRIGVTGGSYGGFMTNWIIGHTDRFKAAASQRCISNWTTMFSTSDIGYFFAMDQIGGDPWKDHDKLWWHSPLKYIENVKTPTLFIHSEEDYRCWWVEAIQMFTALKFHNVQARMCMFRGENHELSRSGKPKHRIRRLKEITEWFDKYLKNKE